MDNETSRAAWSARPVTPGEASGEKDGPHRSKQVTKSLGNNKYTHTLHSY